MYAFAGSADDELRDLSVLSVQPDPDGSRLSVIVIPDETGPLNESRHRRLMTKLNGARGYFRSEVAMAIHRKRTPDLRFRIDTPVLIQ